MQTRSQQQKTNSQGANQASPAAQSSVGTTNDVVVVVKWILFDNSYRKPTAIELSPASHKRALRSLLPLFKEELRLVYKVSVEECYIRFWKPNETLLGQETMAKGWAASIENFEERFSGIPTCYSLADHIVVVDSKLIHLVITIGDEALLSGPEFSQFKRYKETLLNPGMPLSEGATREGYREIQGDKIQVIYDGRKTSNDVYTACPPIQIFHPIFDDFNYFVNNPDFQPTLKDLRIVEELMYYASQVGPKEDYHNRYIPEVRQCLERILDDEIEQETNIDATEADGEITFQIGKTWATSLIVELKRELGEGRYDPSTRAGLRLKRCWVDPSKEAIREKCCCPTFLIAGGGPWFTVMGVPFCVLVFPIFQGM